MSPTKAELAAQLRERMKAVHREAGDAEKEVETYRAKAQKARERLNQLAQEYRDLERVYKRYSNGKPQSDVPAAPEPARPETEQKVRLLDLILAYVRDNPGINKSALTDAVVNDMEAGLVLNREGTTEIKDPRKMASSMIGNMAKRRHIVIEPAGLIRLGPRQGGNA